MNIKNISITKYKLPLEILLCVVAFSICFILLSARMSLWGLRSYTVVTGSMAPAISAHSLIFTFPSSYGKGDIITFQRANITVTHRIIDIKNDLFVTKGDANKTADTQPVRKSDIVGKTIIIIPFLGKIATFSKTIPGFILLIAIPTFIFIFFEGKTLKEEWEKEIEKKLVNKLKSVEQTIEKDIKKL